MKFSFYLVMFYVLVVSVACAGAIYDTDVQGRTQLHWAAIDNDIALAKKSLAVGVELEAKDHEGKTAFDYAILYQHLEIAALLHPGAIQTEEANVGLPAIALVSNSFGISSSVVVGAAIAAGTGIAVAASASGEGGEEVSSGHVPRSEDPALPHSPEESPTLPAPQPALPPVHPEISENEASWGLTAIGALSAYRYGLTGRGVVVAYLGEGVLTTHQEFEGRLVEEAEEIAPSELGTQSASLIIANKDDRGMQGIAYDAMLAPFYSTGSLSLIASAYYRSESQNISVVHHDFTAVAENEVSDIAAIYHQWRDRSTIMVVGAGDEALAHPNNMGRLPEIDPVLAPLWLTVVSLDPGHRLSSFSNQCGGAKEWCLSAPGNKLMVASTQGNDHYIPPEEHQGSTVLAAAHVSGAAALLMQLYPKLMPAEITYLLLSSATDLGEPGVDDVYGYGLLNVSAALEPLGEVYFPDGKGNYTRLNNRPIKVGGAFGDSLVGSALGVVDSMGRSFYVLLPYQRVRENFVQKNELFYQQSTQEIRTIEDKTSGSLLSFAMNETQGKIYFDQGDHEIAFYYNEPYQQDHPFLNLNNETISLVADFSISSYDHITFISTSSDRMVGAASKTEHSFSDMNLAIEVGAVREASSILGNDFPKIFISHYSTVTRFMGVGGGLNITPQWQIYGEYYQGNASLSTASEQFSLSSIETQAMCIGLVGNSALLENDEVKLYISQPLRVKSGYFSLLGKEGYVNHYDLQPGGREQDISLRYTLKNQAMNFSSAITYQKEPLHYSASQDDLEAMVAVSITF